MMENFYLVDYNGIWYDKNGNKQSEIKNGNGKGKEYYNNGLVEFEGEYLNGKKWNGKWLIYENVFRLKYENEYINGEKKGKMIEYSY